MGTIYSIQSISDETINLLIQDPAIFLLLGDNPDRKSYLNEFARINGLSRRIVGKMRGRYEREIPSLDFKEGEGLEETGESSWLPVFDFFSSSDSNPVSQFPYCGGRHIGEFDSGLRAFYSLALGEIQSGLDGVSVERRKKDLKNSLHQFNQIKNIMDHSFSHGLGILFHQV